MFCLWGLLRRCFLPLAPLFLSWPGRRVAGLAEDVAKRLCSRDVDGHNLSAQSEAGEAKTVDDHV